jgi:hypothetical protein
MIFLNDTSFVTASYYPSFAEAAAFQIPATQLSQSGTRMGVDCLKDRQVLQKGMPFTAVMCIIAIIAAIFTTVLEFPALWRTSGLAICIAFVVLTFVGVSACLKRNHRTPVIREAKSDGGNQTT